MLLLAALVGLTVALATGQLFGIDRAVADWADGAPADRRVLDRR